MTSTRLSLRWIVAGASALVLLPALVGAADSAVPTTPAASAVPSRTAVADPRPNIIVITTDDQRVSDLVAMPTVRTRIADRGTTFRHSYASYPLCCPARASWMTGQYAHNHGVLGNGSGTAPLGGFPDFDPSNTVATWLQSAGYQTAYVGKYLNKYDAVTPIQVPPGWTDWHAEVSGGHYFDTTLFENGTTNRYQEQYKTDLHRDIALDVIEQRIDRRAPLMLWLSFYAPHGGGPAEPDDPAISTPAVAPRHRDDFAGTPLPRTDPGFNEADVSDKPSYVSSRNRLSRSMIAMMTESRQQRLESLLAVDQAVDRLLDAIAAAGELRNSVIVFSSDNGWMAGEHRIHAGKTVVYEQSARVPLIMRGPGIPRDAVRRQLVANIDLAPTLAEVAGATPGLPVDGRSLLALAADPSVGTRRALVLEAGPRTRSGPMFYTAVRTTRWLYVEYHETGERELYDMANDPAQLANLADDPDVATIRNRLARRLAALGDCAGAECR